MSLRNRVERRGLIFDEVLALALTLVLAALASSCGVLLSRTMAGFVAPHTGLLWMFWLGVPAAPATGGLSPFALQRSRLGNGSPYASLLGPMLNLCQDLSGLRCATHALMFAAFSAF